MAKMDFVSCRRRMRAWFAVFGLLLPGTVRGRESSVEPVSPEMLRDGELVVESCDFAVGTPAGDWRWRLATGQGEASLQEMYVCAESR